ncbi:acyl-CoA thioesterase [Francisella sp. SYW-2]|uniref:acyl-CoA thioesterase n=1 Tax=Francisella sp. SYW-2 TaxID=2610886 RepID=UPI00123E3C39|nr:thioesterase family protein [Francisella sp. SYW-2]
MLKDSLFTHVYKMTIPFFDVDMLEIVWHGNYVKYFEMARCSMLKEIGYDYIAMKKDGFAWPIVDIKAKFIKSARFGQDIDIYCDLIEFENRLKINYTILDSLTKIKLCQGYTTQLAVDINKKETCFVTPHQWQQKIKEIIRR